jgi:large repetitive protein
VPKGSSLTVHYKMTYPSKPASYDGNNIATATWDGEAAFTPSSSASVEQPFELTQAGATNKTVSVTDTYAGDLGTVTASDSEPFTKASVGYDRTESGVAGTCTEYDNTATINETQQSASQTVTVCVAKDLTVAKTAIPTFKRTFFWDITKKVDKTLVRQLDG